MKNIYLDVDGVLNALSKKPPRNNTGWGGEWGEEMVNGGRRAYPILWSKELIEKINELDAREDVQIIWLTTWMKLAAQNLAPVIGLTNGSEWPVLVTDRDPHGWSPNAAWWKLELIAQHVSGTDPEKFVWIDDDIDVMWSARNWVDTSPNGLGISPASQHGLAQRHIKQIEDFLSI